MFAVEHFSKSAVMVPIPNKEAPTVAWAFLQHVLSVYGGCAELISDRGSEFKGVFHDLLVDAFIDHRRTSAEHPQADGLAERCVQTLKTALKKCIRADDDVQAWDSLVP
jgi:transposase InsO family protein